ncbi:MAG: hypothetical protein IAF38_16375 [Bacteroidia bacterium]|nr:hypothetical protein [Bacteroidia bacterium]
MKNLLLFLSIGFTAASFSQSAGISFTTNAPGLEVAPISENKTTSWIYYTRFLNDKTIAFSGPDSSVHLLDLTNLSSKRINGMQGKPDAFAFSKNGKWMVATSVDNEIKFWDLKTGKVKYSYGEYAPGYVNTKRMWFFPGDETFAISGSCDFGVRNTVDGTIGDTIKGMPDECAYVLAYTKDGSKIYAGGNSNVWLYDLKLKKVLATKNIEKISVVTDVALSPDQKSLVVAGREGMLLLNADLSDKFELKGHTDWINGIKFSSSGKFLYTCAGSMFGKDRSVKIWNPVSGACVKTMEGHTEDVDALDVSPNGKLIVTGSRDNTIKVWNSKTQQLVCTVVPMIINNEMKFFFYTPSGILYGPNEFFSLTTVKKDGTEITSAPIDEAAKAKIIKVFK